jgi:hypothetical protein
MSFEEMEKQQFEVASNFIKSKLKTQTMKFTNNVMMVLINDVDDDFESISEAIHQVNEARECIPKESKIKFSGIQLVIENKGQMSNQTIDKLDGFGFQYQFGSLYDDENEYTTIFAQSPDYWDKDFEEFLKTFHDFKQKKYEASQKNQEVKGN